MQLRELTFERFEEEASALGVTLPIEQTAAWARLEESIPGRSQWGCFKLVEGDKTLALVSFADYQTHGYHYLRAHHAPVWVEEPAAELESKALAAISDYVRRRDRKQAFIRLSVKADLPETSPVLSGIPYDRTVIVDLAGGDEDILARMKPRGRRDVRKGLREAPVTCADETVRAGEDFAPYYEVMVQTAQRDGFIPAPCSDYQDMIRILGPAHCRVFAARENGTGAIVAWSIDTISGTRGVRYYAASGSGVGRKNVADVLLYFEACELARLGCADFDLMAIGSDFSPSLLGLNEFKTKFCKEVAEVAPDRDLPLKHGLYGALQRVQSVRRARREAAEAKADAAKKAAPREDILPVVLGGDISAYAYGREFHEAFGVRSVALNSGFIGALAHSAIFDCVEAQTSDPEALLAALTRIAGDAPKKTVVVVPTTDALVSVLVEVADRLPANVVAPVPAPEVLARAASKEGFSAACAKLGLPTPATEVVRLAGTQAPAPTGLAFPVVAKPAVSAEYSALYAQGFKKVYSASSQDELDGLWASLREAGFAGDFLVQELVPGDDTHMGALTFYVGKDGKMRAFGAAQTLLEDHAPTMRGNSVAMVARVWPDLMEKAQALVDELGYTGFGEIDVKRDARTGEWVFFELNPRAGRNSYYLAAAGVNPMRAMVSDLVDHAKARLFVADEPALYTLVPMGLVARYLTDDALAAEVRDLVAQGRVFDPQRYDADRGLRRMIDVELTEKNQVRKFARYYPEPTETSF